MKKPLKRKPVKRKLRQNSCKKSSKKLEMIKSSQKHCKKLIKTDIRNNVTRLRLHFKKQIAKFRSKSSSISNSLQSFFLRCSISHILLALKSECSSHILRDLKSEYPNCQPTILIFPDLAAPMHSFNKENILRGISS
jgi:hypothetical protein